MAFYCIQFETMKSFMALKKQASVPDILVVLSKAAEFEDIHFRTGEKQAYREMNKSSAIRYPLQLHIDVTWQKIFLAIQMVLSGASFPGNKHPSLCSPFAYPHVLVGSDLLLFVVKYPIPRFERRSNDS